MLRLISLTSMLKRIFCNMAWAHLTVTQHVLIKMIFGIFAVSCTVHVSFIKFPPLTLNWTRQQKKLVLGLSRPFIEVWREKKITEQKTFHPQCHNYFQVFKRNKKWQGKYFIFKGGWWNSCDCKCISFQYCWQTCKNILYWYCKRSMPNRVAANMPEMCVAVVKSYRHCLWRWANHQFKYQGILPQIMSFFFLF